MTAEYSGDPATSTKDEVRFLVGDTDMTAPLIQDEEIDYLVTNQGSAGAAAIRACEVLATGFARLASDKQVGDLKVSYSNRVADFRALAKDMRRRYLTPIPYVGGVSIADKIGVLANSDRVPNQLLIGKDDFNGPPHQRRDDPYWWGSL